MTTLVIHAPRWTVSQENKRSFAATLQSGVGDEYAIPASLCARIQPGCRVVLLSKDELKRAEGTLDRLQPRSKTNSGMQRYDVHIRNLKIVPWKEPAERLTRTGIAVI